MLAGCRNVVNDMGCSDRVAGCQSIVHIVEKSGVHGRFTPGVRPALEMRGILLLRLVRVLLLVLECAPPLCWEFSRRLPRPMTPGSDVNATMTEEPLDDLLDRLVSEYADRVARGDER